MSVIESLKFNDFTNSFQYEYVDNFFSDHVADVAKDLISQAMLPHYYEYVTKTYLIYNFVSVFLRI